MLLIYKFRFSLSLVHTVVSTAILALQSLTPPFVAIIPTFENSILRHQNNENCWAAKFITARKRILRRLCFYTCLQFCLQGIIPACLAGLQGGWYPSMPCRCPGSHPGVSLRGLARGVSRPTPRGEDQGSGLVGLQAHTRGGGSSGVWPGGSPGPHPGGKFRGLAWGVSRPTPKGVSQHALRQTLPHSWWLLLRVVRILLECILVDHIFVVRETCEFCHLLVWIFMTNF